MFEIYIINIKCRLNAYILIYQLNMFYAVIWIYIYYISTYAIYIKIVYENT